MSQKKYTWYPTFAEHSDIFAKDERLYERALRLSKEHDSGGSYSMVAILSNSKPLGIGYNSLSSLAQLKNEGYPNLCGIHAELALWSQFRSNEMLNGTVTIAGTILKSGNDMSSTLPCIYCAALLHTSGVRWIVCAYKQKLVKVQPSALTIPDKILSSIAA